MANHRFPIVIVLAVATAGAAPAQGDRGATADVLRAIVVERTEVFDSADARFIGYRLANRLHVRTRESVIRRELLFAAGDPVDTARVNETVRNLRALGVFQDVRIDLVPTDSGIVARVRTIDAWTTTPGFDLSTVGSQRSFSVSLAESNLLGTRTAMVVSYQDDPDRSSIAAAIDARRVIGDRAGIGAALADRSDGRAAVVAVRAPFLHLSSRWGAGAAFQAQDTRVLRFDGRSPSAIERLRHDRAMLTVDGAIALAAGPRGYTRLGGWGVVGDNAYRAEGAPRAPEATRGSAGVSFGVRRTRFIQVRDVGTMGRVEDVDLGVSVRGWLAGALASWGQGGSVFGQGGEVASGLRIPAGYAILAASGATYRAPTDSSRIRGSATLVVQPRDRHLLVAHGAVGAMRHPAPGSEYDLGLDAALRAYPAHSFAGDRAFMIGAEYRVTVVPELLRLVGIGVAAFVDHGGAWYGGSPRRTGTDAGVGLRMGSLREAGASVWRLDVSRRAAAEWVPGGWVVTIGSGFVFRGI